MTQENRQFEDDHLMNFLAPWVIADDPQDRADFLAALHAALAQPASVPAVQAPAEGDVLAQALERMDRARAILTDGNPRPECNWGMLDTRDLRAAANVQPKGMPIVNDSWADDWLTNRAELNPHTINLVVRFARALAQKLAAAEKKYGYSDGWRSPDWMDECRAKLMEHVAKGDPRDVAAYCAFLWHHGESTAAPAPDDAKRQLNLNDPAVQKRLAAQWGYVQAPAPVDAKNWYDLRPPMLELGRTYKTASGKKVRMVSVSNAGTEYESMADEDGHHRYSRSHGRIIGRCTGSENDDPLNIPFDPPPSQAPAVQHGKEQP